jgi:hypothetical protein
MLRKRKEGKSEESGGALVPTAHDFSSAAIQRARGRYARSHWTLRYSSVGVLLSVLAGGLFGFSEAVFYAIVGAAGACSLSWITNYFFRADSFEHRYVENLQNAIKKETERKRENLRKELVEHGCSEGAEQLPKLQAKFDSLVELLADKLDTTELTYKRYYGIALEVFLSGVDNLASTLSAMKSVSEIDEDYVDRNLKKLRSMDTQEDPKVQGEIEVLEKRLNMKQTQLEKVKHFLSENEQAMTMLDETTVAIADMDTGKGEAEIDMENSMAALADIMQRTSKYSKQ